jgi:hypothetical protein
VFQTIEKSITSTWLINQSYKIIKKGTSSVEAREKEKERGRKREVCI